MEQEVLPPKHPLNFAIKLQMLQMLRRTDIYIINEDDPEKSLYSKSVRNFHDETLIKYDHNRAKGTQTITFMGEVVAEMNSYTGMKLSQQHSDILGINKKIEAKSVELKKIFEAQRKMSETENLVYQRAVKEFQNARYD